MYKLIPTTFMLFSCIHSVNAETIRLHAAGSLKAVMTEITEQYQSQTGTAFETAFGPSGLLRQRIEKGEITDLFASANMRHPEVLQQQGLGSTVVQFAQNKLCALAQAGVEVDTNSLLAVILDPAIRLGTSTPKADPSGDYAWQLFKKAGNVHAGAFEQLDAKALKLTGGPDSEVAPEGRNQYGWVMQNNKADIFLTYCTNTLLAQKDVPALQIITLPNSLSVGADYGLIVMKQASPQTRNFADYLLGQEARQIFRRYGFSVSDE